MPDFLRLGVTTAIFNSAGTKADVKLVFHMCNLWSGTHILSKTVSVGISWWDVDVN